MNKALTVLAIAAFALAVTACATAVAIAETTKVVAEYAATDAVTKGDLTYAQLSALSTDLAALPQTALPQSDNKLIANIIVQATKHKAASPQDAAIVDGLNGVLGDVQASRPPTLADGQAWAILQDAIQGFKKAVTLAQTP
jgi:hypothetical protein